MAIAEKINDCPRCKSEMKFSEVGGNMRSFPMIVLECTNKNCLWNMTCMYNDLEGQSGEALKKKMLKQWNEGTT